MTLIGETGNITNENSLTVDEIDLTTAVREKIFSKVLVKL